MSVKTKTVHSLAWVTISNLITRLSGFISTLILAKLLLPSDFGLISITEIVLNVCNVIRDLGLAKWLIYRSEINEKIINTVFSLIVATGGVLSLLIILFANSIALFFVQPDAETFIRAMSITIFISSLGITSATLLEKKLAFNKKVLPETLSMIVYGIVATCLAVVGFGVWSIVFGRIIQSIIFSFLMWYNAGWQFKFEFDYSIAKESWNYGRPVVITSVLTMLFLYVDNVYIAKFLGTTELGYYAFAFMLANIPTMLITHVLTKVTFPSYMLLKKNSEQLTNAYLTSIKLTSFVTFPATISLIVIIDDIILMFYADKWVDSIILVQVLSLYGLFRSIGALPGNVLYAIKKHYLIPRFMFVYIILLVLLLGGITPVWGTIGVAITMSSIMVVGSSIWIILANYFLNVSNTKFFWQILPQVLSSVNMFIVLICLNRHMAGSILELFIILFLAGIIYLGSMIFFTKGKILNNLIK